MSYNTDLQNNNTSLQEILEAVNALPEAGGSGDGGIETCTVNIMGNSSWEYGYYMAFEDGEVKVKSISSLNTSITLENVINNSMIGIKFQTGTTISLGNLCNMNNFFLIEINATISTNNIVTILCNAM